MMELRRLPDFRPCPIVRRFYLSGFDLVAEDRIPCPIVRRFYLSGFDPVAEDRIDLPEQGRVLAKRKREGLPVESLSAAWGKLDRLYAPQNETGPVVAVSRRFGKGEYLSATIDGRWHGAYVSELTQHTTHYWHRPCDAVHRKLAEIDAARAKHRRARETLSLATARRGAERGEARP